MKTKRNTFSLVSAVDVEESMFYLEVFSVELKVPYQQLSIFLSLPNKSENWHGLSHE